MINYWVTIKNSENDQRLKETKNPVKMRLEKFKLSHASRRNVGVIFGEFYFFLIFLGTHRGAFWPDCANSPLRIFHLMKRPMKLRIFSKKTTIQLNALSDNVLKTLLWMLNGTLRTEKAFEIIWGHCEIWLFFDIIIDDR